MRKTGKVWSEAQAFENIPSIVGWSSNELDQYASEFAKELFDVGIVECEMRLRTPLASVWICTGLYEGERDSMWIVGGEVPFCEFNTELCRSEFDALGIYAWFFSLWHEKMLRGQEGDLPGYRSPPLMNASTYSPADDVKLSRMRSFLLYRTVSKLLTKIKNEEILARLRTIGVL